jgi:hypothetical protein
LKVQRTETLECVTVRCTFINSPNHKFYKYFAALLLFVTRACGNWHFSYDLIAQFSLNLDLIYP